MRSSDASSGRQPDVRSDLVSSEQFEYNCAHFADWAFYTPPEQFLFHHYDESAIAPLIAHRPMVGIEKYVVNDMSGRFYGVYDTRDVTLYIKTGTWIELPSAEFFAQQAVTAAKQALDTARANLIAIQQRNVDI